MRCRGCNADIELRAGDRIGMRDSCSKCGSDLHTCEHCSHHDPSAYNECHEPNAERVNVRDRANRCDYFSPGVGGGDGADRRVRSLEDLDALFKK